ncbi:hypothetical protein OL239_16655 [Arthrobacter sp. ATA002]|uniref:hypothetical protein n=1 Tax=Arthrobacter sp. ATA002 TaxID=2991715 RepID=UPI0022A75FD8|nr:hypothetical protein [Arthrobacter sp. ATA002]WAP51429.1 hypothetical protein OL239_16655 [Arthrobacter sp. ATA002]
MSTTVHRSGARLTPAASYSKVLPPALVLAGLVLLAGVRAGLDPLGVAALLAGVVGFPALLYKGLKRPFRRRGLPDRLRVQLLAVLTFTGAVVCFVIPVPAPVPLTVAALFVGNAGLVLFRRWLNVSAHVSVITFGVLWVAVIFGTAWAWLLILSPLMMFSRVSLREHTWPEAFAGAALGVATFCCFLVAMTWS